MALAIWTFTVFATDSILLTTCFTDIGLEAFTVESLSFCVSFSFDAKLYFHLPLFSTVTSLTVVPSCNVILTFAPGWPVPEILRSVETKVPLYFSSVVTVGASGLTFTETLTILDERKAALFPVSEEGNVTLTR